MTSEEMKALAERLAKFPDDTLETRRAASTTILALLDRLVEVERERDEAMQRSETERQIAEAVELRVTQQEHLLEERRQRISDLIRDGLGEIGKREAAEASLATVTEALRRWLKADDIGIGVDIKTARESARTALAKIDAGTVEHPDSVRSTCDWPTGVFTFHDSPGEHAHCYVVMPGGAMLALNHLAAPGVDIARAKFIIDACNAKLGGTNGQ